MQGDSPAEAIVAYLEYPPGQAPPWVLELSEDFQRDLREAPRYVCDCCGYRTLLNEGHYEICAVCRWEDDRADNTRRLGGPEAVSGPNHISLTKARANFAAFGAAKERWRGLTRGPRPDEQP